MSSQTAAEQFPPQDPEVLLELVILPHKEEPAKTTFEEMGLKSLVAFVKSSEPYISEASKEE